MLVLGPLPAILGGEGLDFYSKRFTELDNFWFEDYKMINEEIFGLFQPNRQLPRGLVFSYARSLAPLLWWECEVVCLADEVKMLTIQDQRRTSEVPANNSRVGRSLPVPREQRGKFYNENKHGDNGNVAMKAFTAVSKQAVPGRVRGTAWTKSKLYNSAVITAGET